MPDTSRSEATRPVHESLRSLWRLTPGVTYLNHGSFGPSPVAVQNARLELLQELQGNPMDFLVRRMPELIRQSTTELARFLNASPDNVVLQPNATFAMNVVAANVALEPGDEVLLNDHEYGAVIRIWGQKCQAAGARTVLARLPYPLESKESIVDAIMAQVTARTRLIVLSHVTSPTALILPVKEVCERARHLKIPVCIDGPHAPLHVPVNLNELDCDFYTASCHKWLSAPFGSGFLYVRSRLKQGLKPGVVSWGRSLNGESPSWKDEFDWQGTYDATPNLAIPAAIAFFKEIGAKTFRSRTHELAAYVRQRLIEKVGARPISPDSNDWYGSMVAVELPIDDDQTLPGKVHPLQQWLWEQHQIEVPVVRWKEKTLVRVSAHLYNSQSEMDHLVEAVAEWLSRT
ncbi:aminotransferase class V-fold PLP-dependent enzyme [Planctomicrobium sp. SH527]|uniref:aminotransferase class V-fold PLP-dependent enzyme n=1 Tax=Planctomicrobium sp. SH527 TaxID=3448123 RepID=UPI003F5C0C85